jgi:hypothetical protein
VKQMKETVAVPLEQISEMRREATMQTARLEHAILQTVINYIAEEPLPRELVVMALINVSGYWQKKIILATLTDARWKELNGK